MYLGAPGRALAAITRPNPDFCWTRHEISRVFEGAAAIGMPIDSSTPFLRSSARQSFAREEASSVSRMRRTLRLLTKWGEQDGSCSREELVLTSGSSDLAVAAPARRTSRLGVRTVAAGRARHVANGSVLVPDVITG